MQRFFHTLLLIGIIGALPTLSSCERDDICAAGTPTTPLLNIQFFDNTDRTQQKNTSNLQIRELESQNVIFSAPFSGNEVSLPLRTSADATEYEFITDVGGAGEDIDIVSIQYTPQTQYVSRACGFKTVFQGFTVTLKNPDGDTSVWLIEEERQQVNIESIDEVHLFLYH